MHVDDLATHAERAALQLVLIARVLQLGQVIDQVALVDALTLGQDQAQRQVVLPAGGAPSIRIQWPLPTGPRSTRRCVMTPLALAAGWQWAICKQLPGG